MPIAGPSWEFSMANVLIVKQAGEKILLCAECVRSSQKHAIASMPTSCPAEHLEQQVLLDIQVAVSKHRSCSSSLCISGLWANHSCSSQSAGICSAKRQTQLGHGRSDRAAQHGQVRSLPLETCQSDSCLFIAELVCIIKGAALSYLSYQFYPRQRHSREVPHWTEQWQN